MKTPSSVFILILKCIYFSLLLIFSFAVISIVRLHYTESQTSTEIAFATRNVRDRAIERVSFQASETPVSIPLQVFWIDSSISMDQHLIQLIMICSISFLFVYFGLPLYSHLTLHKPIRIIYSQLSHNQVQSKSFFNRDVNALKKKVDMLIQQHASANKVVEAVSKGTYDVEHVVTHDDDVLGNALVSLQSRLRAVSEGERRMTVVHDNIQHLERILKEESDWDALVLRVITFLSKTMGAGVGVIYGWESAPTEESFTFLGAYGVPNKRTEKARVVRAHGQLGEVARNRKMFVMDNVPEGYLVIHSGLGQASATHIVISPLLFKDQLYGAFELGLFRKPESFEIEWLERASESIAAHFFNHQIHSEAKRQLQSLAEKQAAELVEIHRLQRETFNELELKLKEVEEEKRKNVAILEGCVDGVLVFDATGKVDFCNQAAAEILGRGREEVLQQSVTALLPVIIRTDRGYASAMYVKDSVEKEITVRTEASFSSEGGEGVDVLITCTQAKINAGIVFTFFIQKISVDLF